MQRLRQADTSRRYEEYEPDRSKDMIRINEDIRFIGTGNMWSYDLGNSSALVRTGEGNVLRLRICELSENHGGRSAG